MSTITTNPVTVTTIPDSTLGQMLQAAIARAEAAEELAASYAETNTVQRRRMEELQAYVNAAVKRAEAAEAQLAAVPSKAIYDCWYHSDGQTPDESATAVEAWLVSTGVMDKYYRA